MKIYQVEKTIWGKKFTALFIADDDYDIHASFKPGTEIKPKKYVDIRGHKQPEKIEVKNESFTA